MRPSTSDSFSAALVGGESLLIQCADLLRQRGHHVALIVTADAAVRQWAEDASIPCARPVDDDLDARLREVAPDLLLSVANLRRTPASWIRSARLALNFHDGPLPRYAGVNAPAWALLRGETCHGVTWHVMTDEFDAGDIVKRRDVVIAADDTALTLNLKCYQAAAESFADLLVDLEQHRVNREKQDGTARSYFGRDMRPDEAGPVWWNQAAETIAAVIRALDFGTYRNPLAVVTVGDHARQIIVDAARPTSTASTAPAGTVTHLSTDEVHVATNSTDLVLHRFRTPAGARLTVRQVTERLGLVVGAPMPAVDQETRAVLAAHRGSLAVHEPYWTTRLVGLEPTPMPHALARRAVSEQPRLILESRLPAELSMRNGAPIDSTEAADRALAAWAIYLARVSGVARVVFGYRAADITALAASSHATVADVVPAMVDVAAEASVDRVLASCREAFARLGQARSFLLDLPARTPGARTPDRWPLVVIVSDSVEHVGLPPSADLVVAIAPGEGRWRWSADASVFDRAAIDAVEHQYRCLLSAMMEDPAAEVASLSLLDAADRRRLLMEWNPRVVPSAVPDCVHTLIARQAARTPQAPALTFRGETLTFQDVDVRANALAARLVAKGVGPDVLVALSVERSLDAVIGALAILKAGGAYVPIDPAYPVDRVRLMLDDAQPLVVVTETARRSRFDGWDVVVADARRDQARVCDLEPPTLVRPHHLAYVIYTSGSTGRPKGVMVEHRQVVEFFDAMDRRLGTKPGVWLAVTSLSFDISVLELFWTLSRGFSVVIAADEAHQPPRGPDPLRMRRPADFSLFYFAADAGETATRRYDLLLEGARFADAHGFSAVWTPERHFHAFGGLYPNPAVTGAAIAAITDRVQIRAGSVVLPLHHPARVAEEWAVVDNLSGGRVAISVASGWQPNDFVLRPESFSDSKGVLARDLETLRRLWRGEAVEFPGPKGTPVAVRTLPRPVQADLPIWITAAGNPETFEMAGTSKGFLLTHLLGQTVEELAGKIARYRDAWRAAGHAGEGYVTLMLHTFIGDSDDQVESAVRGPLTAYLRTATALVRQAASAFPAFKRRVDTGVDADTAFKSLTPDEMEGLLAYAVERYYRTSGLFGTIEQGLDMVARVRAAGVDEIACLIDFGIETPAVLAHLTHLAALKDAANRSAPMPPARPSYAADALVARHGVTHVQCTPSQARMWLAEPAMREALGRVDCLLVGGEALPPDLASELRVVLGHGRLLNMYGPTETTVWSSAHDVVARHDSVVPIGAPLANSRLYVLDSRRQLLPVGVPGELWIGGASVARGYLHRADLTAERFAPDPFSPGDTTRMYRTGDLVRYRADGAIEFLGRLDQQVKVHGHRIELGEIEACLLADTRVADAVVVARQDRGHARLVAYVVAAERHGADRGALAQALKTHVRGTLPDAMVPAQVVVLDAFPQTPNGKIDRRALPAPEVAETPSVIVESASTLEQQIAAVWSEVLGHPAVALRDNFFDLGGDSLLAVQAHRRLRDLAPTLALTDLFRHPTVHALAEHLSHPAAAASPVVQSQDRGVLRRQRLQRRHAG